MLKREKIMVSMSNLTVEQIKELAFTEKDIQDLERVKQMPITFDAECPETTPERAVKFRRVNPVRRKDAI